MKLEELLQKPLDEMTDDEIQQLIEELRKHADPEKLRTLERKARTVMRGQRPRRTKKEIEREDELNKLLLGG